MVPFRVMDRCSLVDPAVVLKNSQNSNESRSLNFRTVVTRRRDVLAMVTPGSAPLGSFHLPVQSSFHHQHVCQMFLTKVQTLGLVLVPWSGSWAL